MSRYMQYAIFAVKEALDDANWHPQGFHGKAATVSSSFSYNNLAYGSYRAYVLAPELAASKRFITPLLLLPKRYAI